jgi:hypothetical protein
MTTFCVLSTCIILAYGVADFGNFSEGGLRSVCSTTVRAKDTLVCKHSFSLRGLGCLFTAKRLLTNLFSLNPKNGGSVHVYAVGFHSLFWESIFVDGNRINFISDQSNSMLSKQFRFLLWESIVVDGNRKDLISNQSNSMQSKRFRVLFWESIVVDGNRKDLPSNQPN